MYLYVTLCLGVLLHNSLMKTTLSWFLSVTLGLLMGIADSSSQVWHAYTHDQLLNQTVVSNALFGAPPAYLEILKQVTTNKVSAELSPVHLYSCSNDRFDWLASGTHFRENDMDYIVTSGHIFSKDRRPQTVLLPEDPGKGYAFLRHSTGV